VCLGYFLAAVVGISQFIVRVSSCNLKADYVVLIESLTILFLFPCPLVFHECLVLELGAASSLLLLVVEAALKSDGAYIRAVELFFFLFLIAVRESHRASSRKSAMMHQAKLDKVWEDFLSEGEESSLMLLEEVAQACHRKARKTAKLRQFRMAYNPVTEEDSRTDMDRIRALETFASSRRFRTPSKFAASEAFTSFASVSLAETKEITNFDQLNAQGVTMQKLLVDKLLVLVERLQTAHGSTARFEETPMKSFEASCEKILRKYHGDVARHTDLVRQSIMFDRIQDIADCLQTLMEDREVVIVSLKNRLAGRDKVKNLGHVRDVCLKARLITEQTRFYGICAFVCEIRLVLTCLQSAATTSMLKDLKGYRRMHQVNISIRCLLFWSRLDCSAWIRRLKHHKIHKLSRVLVETLAETGREAGSLNSLFRSAAHTLTDEERHKDLLRQRCLFAGDTLGKRLQELQHAVKKSSASSVLFTSIPCTLAMQKTWFKALLIIWGIFYAVRGFGEGGLWQTYMRKQVFQVRSARMIVLQRRQDSVSAGGNYSLQLGWMLNGCKTSSAVQGVEDGDIFYFSFPSLESANAFYFITDSRSGTEGRDPVRFRLDVTSASGSPWQLANTSWTLKSGTKCDWDRYNAACIPRWDETYPTDLQRGAENVISLVTPLYMAAGTVFFLFPVVLGCFSGPIVSILGRPRMGVVCFSFAFWGTGVLGIAAAISSAVHGDSAGVALLFFLLGWGSSTTGLSLVFWEEKFLPTVLFNACITVVASISFYFITLGGGNFQFPITGLVLLVSWMAVQLMRRRAIHRAWLGIEDDVKYYNEVWRALTADQGTMGQVKKLKQIVASGSEAWSKGAICQLQRGEPGHGISSLQRPMGYDAARITCLDQLYNQAMLLELPFLRKVKELLKRWGGLVQEKAGDESEIRWVRYEGQETAALHGWARLKGFDRSIEKLHRSYKGKVWRLLDVVRQSMVFESLEEIVRCLKGICEDQELVILRVKNRFDPDFTSQQSGAYRDVCLNVRLDNEETHRLGVNFHVCELQLSLKDYKSWAMHSNGHQRYVAYRNTRAE